MSRAPDQHESEATRRRRNAAPLRFLSLVGLITVIVLVALLWSAFDASRRFENVALGNLRIEELRGRIIVLDEVLTMSARMAAATGDPVWQLRYDEHVPALDAAIAEATSLVASAEATALSDAANQALIEMEERSFAFAREGRLDEAQATLESEAYSVQKARYAQGMAELGVQMEEAAASALRAQRLRVYAQLIVGAIAIILILCGWVVVMKLVHEWLTTRTQLDKIERDLDLAREIQSGLMPNEDPTTPGFEVKGWSRPADKTGGDYFDWMQLPGGKTLISLADVTGHGIGPALIASVSRAYMRSAAMGVNVALAEAIGRVNDLLHLDMPEGRFVTAAIGVLDASAAEMALISAGQAPIFFYHATTDEVEMWAADEMPLGIASGLTYMGVRTVRFEPRDMLVLLTDGFFEWANADGEQYGIRRLEAFVASHASGDPRELIAALCADVQAHAGDLPQPDDLTIVVVKRSPSTNLAADSCAHGVERSGELALTD